MKDKLLFLLLLLVILLPFAAYCRVMPTVTGGGGREGKQGMRINKNGKGEEQNINYGVAGSTLPDCSHACGSCMPCRRVTVSFKCTIADACPVAYRCICKGKIYPVPSARP